MCLRGFFNSLVFSGLIFFLPTEFVFQMVVIMIYIQSVLVFICLPFAIFLETVPFLIQMAFFYDQHCLLQTCFPVLIFKVLKCPNLSLKPNEQCLQRD